MEKESTENFANVKYGRSTERVGDTYPHCSKATRGEVRIASTRNQKIFVPSFLLISEMLTHGTKVEKKSGSKICSGMIAFNIHKIRDAVIGSVSKEVLVHFCKGFGRLLREKHLFFSASAITFNLFLCAIPFTLILLSILGYVLSIDAAFNEILRFGRELFPSFSFETAEGDVISASLTIESLIRPLVEARRIFGITGIVVLMVVSQGLFHTLKHVIFDLFDIQDRRHPILEIVYNFFAFGVVGSVFLFFSMALYLVSINPLDTISIPYTLVVFELGWLNDMIRALVPFFFTPLLFWVLFRYVSEKQLSWVQSLFSAVTFTVLFTLAKIGLSVYLEYAVSAYRYFYQGYTVLILLAIWVFYTSVLFVLTG
ncbi:MAG: hypothetical protein DA443_10070, partial [Bacteroidetes bacterium]